MAIRSEVLPQFWTRYKKLPPAIRKLAKRKFKIFQVNPHDPELNFRKKKGKADCWSVDIDFSYRALGIRKDDAIHWFFIGDHVEYDRMLTNKLPNPSSPKAPKRP